ncbi:MAG: sensor histidine kinase [Pararoseburia sp.]|nr:sensor histidine kinase [Lachnospiraceae bacterium]MDY4794034.1 sensor histidine kinase [Pararoseburia sp.]
MWKGWKQFYNRSGLATKIRLSYLILLVPVSLILFYSLFNLWYSNQRYEDMINSTLVASEFSLDFKKDFDYEIYLLIVGNKSVDESKTGEMLAKANGIVDGLEDITESKNNQKRLDNIKKYLTNLDTYTKRIKRNIEEGNLYQQNLEIWENDVQIVTTLVRDEISQYTYYEVRAMQQTREDYQRFFKNMIRFCVISFIIILGVDLFLSYYIPRSITKPFRELNEVTKQVAQGNLSVRSNVQTGEEAAMLSDSMNIMIDKINELLEQVKTEQIRLRKAEFELLQAQINPHFLYNTLDAIIWLAEAGEQKRVVSMVRNLSDFFRTSLNRGKDKNSIKEELLHVRSYLEIQKVRYQDILSYEIDVPEELNRYSIPKITIQPLVENALYHGIKNKRGMGHILIQGIMKEDCYEIIVKDDGIGISRDRLIQVQNGIKNKVLTGKDFFGLYNVNERIRLNFGEGYGIQINSIAGEETTVKIILPYVVMEQ